MKLWSLFRSFLSACWRGITHIRSALSNILFLVMIAIIYFVYLGGTPEPLPERAALLLNITGTVVDEKSFVQPLQALLGEPSPADHEVLLRDVLDAIKYAESDPAINSLVLELNNLVSVGISKTLEISRALDSFKETGKPVIAVGDYYTQDQYLLASHADTIILHPLGGVMLEGFSSYHNYFREALEKLSVNMHVFKAGEHKSVAEPFLRDDMSAGEKEITSRWLLGLWDRYSNVVEQRRHLSPGAVNQYVENYAANLSSHGGDLAATSLADGLVDELMARSDANDFLSDLVGATNDDGLYEAVVFERYIDRKRPLSLLGVEGDRVAVITAQGAIQVGEQPPGGIGGDSLARLIRTTAAEDGVAAIVLRINSGGGSVFASEVIRQALLNAKADGLPVVVSMGAVAASGGYYIAAEADQIWATPTTITGSIGVFAAFPTFERLMERGGIHTDGVGTTQLAGSMRVDRPLNEQVSLALSSSVQNTYQNFLGLVASGRGMTLEQVDAIAQGRVWNAMDAKERGLIDNLGGLEEAIDAAAQLASLQHYEVDYVGLPLSARELLLQQLSGRMGSLNVFVQSALTGTLATLVEPFRLAVSEIEKMDDPAHLYIRCLACSQIH